MPSCVGSPEISREARVLAQIERNAVRLGETPKPRKTRDAVFSKGGIVAQLSPLQLFLVCSRLPQLELRRGGTMTSCVSSRGTCREGRPFCRPGVRSRRAGGRARGMSGASSGHVALQRACYFKARTGAAPVFLLIFTGRCGAKIMREACPTFGVQSKPLPLHFRCCLQRRRGATAAGGGASCRADCASQTLSRGPGLRAASLHGPGKGRFPYPGAYGIKSGEEMGRAQSPRPVPEPAALTPPRLSEHLLERCAQRHVELGQGRRRAGIGEARYRMI